MTMRGWVMGLLVMGLVGGMAGVGGAQGVQRFTCGGGGGVRLGKGSAYGPAGAGFDLGMGPERVEGVPVRGRRASFFQWGRWMGTIG